jgi:hypothetical protein
VKYGDEIGPVDMIHISSFIKTGSGIQKLIVEIQKHANKMEIA